jgi:uncharacterized protein
MDRRELKNLKTLPAGERVLVDSNILTYHLLNHAVYGPTCRTFMQDVQNEKYYGFITPIVISETLFNFIKADIFRTYGAKPAEIASFIKGHPEVLGEIPLNKPKELFDIFNLLPIGKHEVKEALEMVSKYALLTNDALNAATMKVNGITNIATNDNDFGRVDWMNIWKP